MTPPNREPSANGVPDGKLAPELAAWEGRAFDREAFLAGLREVEETGGVELKDFLHELEEGLRDGSGSLPGRRRQLTVFATSPGPLPGEFNEGRFHPAPSAPVLSQAEACLGPQQVHEVTDASVTVEFLLLRLREASFLPLDDQFVHAFAIRPVEIEPEDRFGHFGREPGPLRLDQATQDGSFGGCRAGLGHGPFLR